MVRACSLVVLGGLKVLQPLDFDQLVDCSWVGWQWIVVIALDACGILVDMVRCFQPREVASCGSAAAIAVGVRMQSGHDYAIVDCIAACGQRGIGTGSSAG